MPHPCPHHLALFSLVPVSNNERAKAVIAHPDNSHLVSTLPNGVLGLDVCFHQYGKSTKILATLGRGVDADIYVAGSSIAKIQCSFEIDPDTGVIMFYDKSHGCTSQVFGEGATPFEYERPRKVVVGKTLNTIIGMGGERRNLIQFELEWHQDPTTLLETIKDYRASKCERLENPRLARTADEMPTEVPSRRETRPHTPGFSPLKMRYVKGDLLGAGHFGAVYKAIDVDSGRFMAVKILRRPKGLTKQREWRQSVDYALKREVETLSKITHPHIVDYITSQGWDGPEVEIFMGLEEGTLESLIESGADAFAVANSVFPQMLRALDCVACSGIIHRDVKPENILYVSRGADQYHFHLGDFGLSNRVVDAATDVGSPLYMAPEVRRREVQTCKADVWSLFATMLWTMDINGFRQRQFKVYEEVQAAILLTASKADSVSKIQEMANINPEKRASAAQMLVKCFNGEGLSTPRGQVPALPVRQSSIGVPTVSPTPTPPVLTARDIAGHLQAREREEPGSNKKAAIGMDGVRRYGRPKYKVAGRVHANGISKLSHLCEKARFHHYGIPGAFPRFT